MFSQIRALGGNSTHPTTTETISHIRTLCLTKSVKEIVSNSSVEMENDDSCFLTVSLVDNLDIDMDNNNMNHDIDDDFDTSNVKGMILLICCQTLR